jgi:hypothetical protein
MNLGIVLLTAQWLDGVPSLKSSFQSDRYERYALLGNAGKI